MGVESAIGNVISECFLIILGVSVVVCVSVSLCFNL